MERDRETMLDEGTGRVVALYPNTVDVVDAERPGGRIRRFFRQDFSCRDSERLVIGTVVRWRGYYRDTPAGHRTRVFVVAVEGQAEHREDTDHDGEVAPGA